MKVLHICECFFLRDNSPWDYNTYSFWCPSTLEEYISKGHLVIFYNIVEVLPREF